MTHELGHSAGLRHCDNTYRDNTMYYSSVRMKQSAVRWNGETRQAESI